MCIMIYNYYKVYVVYMHICMHTCVFLEGLGRSGDLVGLISTYSGASPTLWCRVMAKTSREDIPSTV